jgi:hypothetical protein
MPSPSTRLGPHCPRAARPTRPVDEVAAALARGRPLRSAMILPSRKYPLVTVARHNIMKRVAP